VFEALACGIPLVCAPWHDTEELFPDGSFLKVRNGEEATAALRLLTCDREFAAEMANTGLHAIQDRHTCAHRVQELLDIIRIVRPGVAPPAPRAGRELNQVAES
jgi:spore maturation protein CgeB